MYYMEQSPKQKPHAGTTVGDPAKKKETCHPEKSISGYRAILYIDICIYTYIYICMHTHT